MEYTKEQYLADLTEMKSKLQADFEAKADEKTAAREQKHAQQIDELKAAIEEAKNLKPEVTAKELNALKEDLALNIKAVEKFSAKVNAVRLDAPKQETKSFNDILAETIQDNIEEIISHKRGSGQKSFRLKGFEDEKIKEVKSVGDMSTSGNFTGASNFTTDFRSNIIETPYNRVWLADVLQSGSSSQSSSVLYPKENGGEGGAALWTDPTADKAQMDFDLTTQSAYFKWIAGWVVVAREMLDDIPFMTSYIQSRMLISLKKAENAFILNGSSDTNPVTGMIAAATAYSGSMTTAVDKVIDAGWGQIVEETDNFYTPTHVILKPRDAVAIGLNKASGSQEYDLPAGSVAFSNGKLTIGGITSVTTTDTNLNAGDFITFDQSALMFIRRMMPELRMFEDATLAKKNKIMFRIEERATLAIFNNDAIVSGSIA